MSQFRCRLEVKAKLAAVSSSPRVKPRNGGISLFQRFLKMGASTADCIWQRAESIPELLNHERSTYRLLGKIGLRVCEASLSTMTFGDEWEGAHRRLKRRNQLPDERILFHNPTACEYVVRTQELRVYRFTAGADTHFYIPVPIVKIFSTVA